MILFGQLMVTIRHLFYSKTWSHCWWTPRFAECDDSRCGIHNTFINYDNLDPGPDPIKKNFSVKLKVLGFCIFRNQLKIEINWEFSASFFFVYVVLETSYVKKVGAIYSKQLFRHFKPVFWLLKISFSKVKIFQFLVSLEDRLSWQAIVPGCVVVNGQRACLVLRWSEFESRWSLQFSCKMCVWKE